MVKYGCWTIAVLILIVVAWGFIFYQNDQCVKSGGVYVRGILWYECIEGKK